jgi:tripartite-type tricarboxylate transporter receptor subunit TctC
VAALSGGAASAQSYPTRPVRLIVGFAAGGGTDIVARLIGQHLSAQLGEQFVVENRTGPEPPATLRPRRSSMRRPMDIRC